MTKVLVKEVLGTTRTETVHLNPSLATLDATMTLTSTPATPIVNLTGDATSSSTVSADAMWVLHLPANYVDGSNITFYVTSKTSTNLDASSVDVTAYKASLDTKTGSDLCATAAVDIVASHTDHEVYEEDSFTITGTTLAAGDRVMITVLTTTTDDGGADGSTVLCNPYVTFSVKDSLVAS